MDSEHQGPQSATGGHADPGRRIRRPWVPPELQELPRLTDLTLQTGSPIPGVGDPGSGSTVF